MTLTGVHEMHGRVDLCSSLAYFVMTHPLPEACKLPIKTLVARQLPTNKDVRELWRYKPMCNSEAMV